MIGPKLDVRCQMPDVDAVCSAGHSEAQTNMIKFVMRFREADTKLAPRLTEGRRTQHKTTNVGLNVK